MTNEREEFFDVGDIIKEVNDYLQLYNNFDVVTIVGEGEPTLYLKLGTLIKNIKKLTSKPIAVITNGALLYDDNVKEDLYNADIVLPTLDAFDEDSYRKINRSHGKIKYDNFLSGLIEFSKNYKGQLWLEVMIVKGLNDSKEKLLKLKEKISLVNPDKVYINVPARPPAEKWVEIPDDKDLQSAIEILNGISIQNLISTGFHSEIKDDFKAVLSIIKRHPMNNFEIKTFLKSRKTKDIEEVFNKLNESDKIEKIFYKGYTTYRIKQ